MNKRKKIRLIFILFIALLWAAAIFKIYSIMNKYKESSGKIALSRQTDAAVPLKRNTPEEIFFSDYIKALYSDYYDIENVYVYNYVPDDEDIVDDENAKYYFVTIEKKLKYNSVYKLPFVAGMKKAVDELDPSSRAKEIYNKRTNELKQYIGLTQIENNIFKLIFSEQGNFKNVKVRIATYHSEISASALKPPEDSVMFKEGYDFIYFFIVSKLKKINYNNFKAINYADKYSSNPMNAGKDQKLWNKNYKAYENDCANFVSQCIYAGGIEETKIWYPESLYWIRTGSPKYADIGGVTTYMQRKNLFSITGYSGASAGGFICLIKESHVVFITSNDSITILFNGHTNDRKRVSFPHLNDDEALYLTPNN